MWYLIVSIPDPCTLTYFEEIIEKMCILFIIKHNLKWAKFQKKSMFLIVALIWIMNEPIFSGSNEHEIGHTHKVSVKIKIVCIFYKDEYNI